MKELTEKELRTIVRSGVRLAVRHCLDHGRTPTAADCILVAEKAVHDRLVSLNSTARRGAPATTGETALEIDRWMYSARMDINEMAERALRSTMAELKSREITSVGIRAVVEDILREQGFPEYRFTPQAHRVKVAVRMPQGRRFSFCIRHAHVQDDLSHVREGLDCALRLSGLFDKDTTIA